MSGLIVCLLAVFAPIIAISGSAPNSDSYVSIAAIDSLPQTQNSVVTVRATLTMNDSPAYIQDSTGGAAVDELSAQDLKIGDELLITGNVEDNLTGLTFRKPRVLLLWHGSPVPPLSVTADEAALGKFAGLLIEVHGRLIGTERRQGETWLRLESGNQLFLGRLKSETGSSLLPRMENGSILRLRGVCTLQPRDTRYQGGFAVLLRSAEDVAVISGPPWWSLRHLFELGILLGLVIIAGHLTVVQMLKSRFRVIMAERARMGHDLHDTLSQSFAGLSYQIQAARKIAPRANDLLIHHLDLALNMVRHSHSEAHRSIMMLRPQPLAEGVDLRSAIQASIDQSTADCPMEARFTIRGSAVRLPLTTTDMLYRIAQEAIANALRHGHPSVLEVNLDYTPASVCLSVRDNGTGFELNTVRGQGFGLAGMRERVRALRGNFSVVSEPGGGTHVRAEIYLGRNAGVRLMSTVQLWRPYYWDRLRRLFENKRPEPL